MNNFIQTGLRTCMAFTVVMVSSLQLRCQGEKDPGPKVQGIMYRSLLPLGLYQGKVVQYDKTLYLYEAGDDMAIQYPVGLQRSKITVDQEGEIVSDELEELSTIYRYVLYRRNDSIGLHYDSLHDPHPTRIQVDSVLVSQGVFNARKFFRGGKDSLSLVSAVWDSSKTILTEKYIPQPGTKKVMADSIVLIYARNLDKYSFSIPGTGSLPVELKVCRLQFITNPVEASSEEVERYRREIVFEITETFFFLDDIEGLLKDFRSRRLHAQ